MRHPLGLIRDEKGSTAVEFALVGMMFMSVILFTMVVAEILYFGQKLDFATEQATRQIIVGKAQTQTTPPTLAGFTQSLCAQLPAAMSCSDVIVNLYVVPKATAPGYYAYVKSDQSGLTLPALTPGSGQFTLGSQGDYQYLQVIYPITFLPSFMTAWLDASTMYNGKPAYLIISTAAFRVESY
ncbi:TadE-like protein [Methylobacterium sp. ap11]|jgi:Flp pilus assembly protein TadG|uniref:TadE/TadG family type IV pilus assembly protein n=1 Tax=Methylobacterium sp. ap11 TaxID=1761799 RepID=UPI0008B864AC|nr:TadE/TadG family type IV pilus assembly protein [Methylobacterium sp. ap11]SEP48798.1 TadE-like protein [Methylobacterium sp. ap11]